MSKKDKTRKQISFDLTQEKLRQYYPKPKWSRNATFYKNAYRDIRRFMRKNGFKWRQGSIYVSKEAMTRVQLVAVAKKMSKELPWLALCASSIDYTYVSPVEYSLLGVIGESSNDSLKKDSFEVDIASPSTDSPENQKTQTTAFHDLIANAQHRASLQTETRPIAKNELER